MWTSEIAIAGPIISAILNRQPVTEDYGIEDVIPEILTVLSNEQFHYLQSCHPSLAHSDLHAVQGTLNLLQFIHITFVLEKLFTHCNFTKLLLMSIAS